MYIIDKNTDYYDYYSHIYGIDKKVVYDRRGSIIIDDDQVLLRWSNLSLRSLRTPESFLLLEIGYVQYLIGLDNFKKHVIGKMGYSGFREYYTFGYEIVRIFQDNKHYFDTPVSVRGASVAYAWTYDGIKYKFNGSYQETIDGVSTNPINNPILSNTFITKIIDPETVWKELQNYISSLNNDKDVDLVMTDVERAEIHGFDKKISFRNPIK